MCFNVRTSWTACIRFWLLLLAATVLRAAGLWHGLDQDLVFHPNAPKQVQRLECYLRGEYVVHTGNRFIDGYPYGLNRVDEAILRIWLHADAWTGRWASGRPETSRFPTAPPDHAWLYKAGRVLRLLYGVLATLLIYAAARRWGSDGWAALNGALLYAAAPLAVTVTHSVTGDVGVDLFVAVALWAASALATEGCAIWWLVFGAACGAGFTCKFQGALAAWMALPALLAGLFDGRRGCKRVLSAVLLSTPQRSC